MSTPSSTAHDGSTVAPTGLADPTGLASADVTAADPNEWRSYDEFAAGIDTYRLANVSLDGTAMHLTLDDDATLHLEFRDGVVHWSSSGLTPRTDGASTDAASTDGASTDAASTDVASTDPAPRPAGGVDPYDAVRIRPDVVFVHLPLESREREALTVVYSESTHRAIVARSAIAEVAVEGTPQVGQTFWSAVTDGGDPTGDAPGPSRDLIGTRNLYRYSPHHLYEHVYMSSERYAWQCVQGVQRGHGDMDLSTVWKFADGLYLFCFREFRIAVASVWLHDLGDQLMTTGAFLGLTGDGAAEHSRAGGRIIPLGTVAYPDVQPV